MDAALNCDSCDNDGVILRLQSLSAEAVMCPLVFGVCGCASICCWH